MYIDQYTCSLLKYDWHMLGRIGVTTTGQRVAGMWKKIGVEIGGAFNEIIIFEQDIGKIEDC